MAFVNKTIRFINRARQGKREAQCCLMWLISALPHVRLISEVGYEVGVRASIETVRPYSV